MANSSPNYGGSDIKGTITTNMTESNNHSVSFNFNIDNSSTFNKPKRLAYDLCVEHRLPEGNQLVRNPRNGKKAILKNEAAQILNFCRTFRTIPEHLEHLEHAFPQLKGQAHQLDQVIKAAEDSGLMILEQDVATRLISQLTTADNLSNPVVCIQTCDRPENLTRLLESINRNCDTSLFEVFYVLDDSRSIQSASENQAICEQHHHDRFNLKYFGLEEQNKLIASLTEKLPECTEEINFLIAPNSDQSEITTGRTNNLGLLLSVGTRLIFIDDDVLCEVYSAPFAEPGAQISSASKELEFYEDNSQWQHLAADDQDALSRHANCVGKPISHLAKEELPADGSGLSIGCITDIPNIEASPDVIITTCGTLGDPGTADKTWLLQLTGSSRSRLTATKEKYELANEVRNVWAGRSRAHFTQDFSLISQMTGIDNRKMLPPYLPFFRNQDFLFGALTQFIYPNAFLMEMPWGVPHYPAEQRAWADIHNTYSAQIDFPYFSGIYVLDLEPGYLSDNPGQRMQALSNIFNDLGSGSPERIRELLRDQILSTATSRLCGLQENLNSFTDAPDYWKADIEAGITSYQKIISGENSFRIGNIPDSLSDDQVPAYLAGMWSKFGDAIKAWPAIRNAMASVLNQ